MSEQVMSRLSDIAACSILTSVILFLSLPEDQHLSARQFDIFFNFAQLAKGECMWIEIIGRTEMYIHKQIHMLKTLYHIFTPSGVFS